ncbi:MAG: winged helix-turn-helix domain-containing tetratricopeptide repeat protein [Terriglobales bacterium]
MQWSFGGFVVTHLSSCLVRFGDFDLDLRTGELRRHGVSLNLPAQPAKILVALVGRAGEVVTRSELAEQVWGEDTFVNFDQGLNFAVRQIRAALGDDSDTPRFIETLPKRGYRFIAAVNKSDISPVLSPAAAQSSAPPGKTAGRIPVYLVALAAVGLSLAFIWSQLRERRLSGRADRIQSLAVLPLHNLSRDPEQEYFSDGMTDELITELAKLSTLRVISHTSVERYKQTKRTLRDIAQELGVDAIVEGTVMRSGDRVRITAQLIDARSDKHLWAESYERDLGHSEGRSYEGSVVDLIRLQSEVARSITDEIAESLKADANAHVNSHRDVTPEAYDLYLRGLYFSGRLSPDNLQKAFGYFNQAIEKDRSFAPAYAGLAESYGWAAGLGFLPAQTALQKSEVAATKALEIDPNSGMGHHAMAWVKYARYWDFPGAEREFQRAIQLNRNNVTAHVWYGMYLAQRQRTGESWSEMQRAKQLDPFSSIVNSLSMTPLLTSHQYDRLIEEASLGLKTDPNDGLLNWFLTTAFEQKGDLPKAIDQGEKQAVAFGEDPQRAKKEFADMRREFSAQGARAYWLSRQKSLAATAWTDPFDMAVVDARLGESEAMFASLDKAYQQRSASLLYWEQTQPAFDRFRTDSRLQNFVRRTGLAR